MTGADGAPRYVPRSEGQLAALPPETLLAEIIAAREADDLESARRAAGILAFMFEPTIRAWVKLGMKSQGPEAIEDVTMDVLASVIHSSFDGKLIGEFGAMLKTISKRRVADYFRAAERHSRNVELPEEHEGEDDSGPDTLGYEDEYAIVITDMVDRVLDGRNEMHCKVIRLYGPEYLGFGDRSAAETVAEINADSSDDTVTEANVHQIWKRFKDDIAEELGHG